MSQTYGGDFLVEFSYLSGGIDAIADGRGNKRPLPANPSALAPLAEPVKRGSIVLPRFIAVYQTLRPLFLDEEGQERFYEREFSFDSNLPEVVNYVDDPLHPQLIHLIYHQDFIPRDIMERTFRDPRRRVQFSPINRIPQFYDKPAMEVDELLREVTDEIEENRCSLEELARKHASDARDLGNRIALYGLTRQEQVILDIFLKIPKRFS